MWVNKWLNYSAVWVCKQTLWYSFAFVKPCPRFLPLSNIFSVFRLFIHWWAMREKQFLQESRVTKVDWLVNKWSFLWWNIPLSSGAHQQDALPWHPAYRQHGSALDAVVVPTVQVSAHAKVSDLYRVVFTNQAIPRGQVSMDKVQRGEVLHPRCYLSCHIAQMTETGEKREETGLWVVDWKTEKNRPTYRDLVCSPPLTWQ